MKIYFSFKLENFFSKEENFKNLFCYEKLITKNKFFGIDILKYSRDLFSIDFRFQPIGMDHGGIEISFSLFSYQIILQIRDKRHWDDNTWNWEEHNE